MARAGSCLDHGGVTAAVAFPDGARGFNQMRRGGFCSYGKTTGKLRETDADDLGLTPAGRPFERSPWPRPPELAGAARFRLAGAGDRRRSARHGGRRPVVRRRPVGDRRALRGRRAGRRHRIPRGDGGRRLRCRGDEADGAGAQPRRRRHRHRAVLAGRAGLLAHLLPVRRPRLPLLAARRRRPASRAHLLSPGRGHPDRRGDPALPDRGARPDGAGARTARRAAVLAGALGRRR